MANSHKKKKGPKGRAFIKLIDPTKNLIPTEEYFDTNIKPHFKAGEQVLDWKTICQNWTRFKALWKVNATEAAADDVCGVWAVTRRMEPGIRLPEIKDMKQAWPKEAWAEVLVDICRRSKSSSTATTAETDV